MDLNFSVDTLVMQPATLCNLNCRYCYLPERVQRKVMKPDIAMRVADGIQDVSDRVEVVWHAGEPLTIGIKRFIELVEPFEPLRRAGVVTHAIQTNATLINASWCDVFRRYNFRVGISVDGPIALNHRRLDHGGRPAYERIMRGVEHLNATGIPFSAICVVGADALGEAKPLYEFFCGLGCSSLGINRDETLGVHKGTEGEDPEGTTKFWEDMFAAWQENPVISVRDFRRILPSLVALGNEVEEISPDTYDIFPCVAWDGDVVLLAPEFLNTPSRKYGSFAVGNIRETNLRDIVSLGKHTEYVRDFVQGVKRCKTTCEYFSLCFGGQAGNKYFEHQTTDATETAFCRNSEKRLANAILNVLQRTTERR